MFNLIADQIKQDDHLISTRRLKGHRRGALRNGAKKMKGMRVPIIYSGDVKLFSK